MLKRLRQQVGAGHRILNRQVDANPPGWRHRVRGIADAQETFSVPTLETVDLHREQLHLFPIPQLLHALSQVRRELRDAAAKHRKSLLLNFLEQSLPND